MKRRIAGITVIALLALSAVAFGYGPGGWWGGGPMMGQAFGPAYCQGPGYGMGTGYMMGFGPGSCTGTYGVDQKFLDETRDLRKDLQSKRFEYFEAIRNPETTPETIAKLEKEITELQQKIYEKAPKTAFRGGRFGNPGWTCPGPLAWR